MEKDEEKALTVAYLRARYGGRDGDVIWARFDTACTRLMSLYRLQQAQKQFHQWRQASGNVGDDLQGWDEEESHRDESMR